MKNKNILLYIIIILMLGGIIAFSIYVKETNKKEDNTSTQKQETNTKKDEKKDNPKKEEVELPIVEEQELSDEVIKKDVYDKLNLIFGLNCSLYSDIEKFSINNNSITNSWIMYCDSNKLQLVFKNSLTKNDKLAIALSSANSNDISVAEVENIKDRNIKQRMAEFPPQVLSTIKIDEVKEKYKDIFDENITSFNKIEYYGPYSYYYDYTDKIYYKTNCHYGGAGPMNFSLYINRITQADSRVYVYMNFVRALIGNNSFNDSVDTKTFSEGEIEVLKNFKIDESNYKEFKNYRIVFKKNNNGTYSYEKTEEVK